MKQYKMSHVVLITVPVFFLTALSACAGPEPIAEGVSMTAVEEITPADAIDMAEVAGPTGLDTVMDGSSLEAFEKSLEKVRETGSEADYNSIQSALEYLLIYDLGAKRNREKLAARLDGITGHEILARVKWRTPKQ